MKLWHEETKGDYFNEAKALMARAYRVYFLGVGFSPNPNMDRLDVLHLADNKAHATGYNLTSGEFNQRKIVFGSKLQIQHNVDCNEMLNNQIDWLDLQSE